MVTLLSTVMQRKMTKCTVYFRLQGTSPTPITVDFCFINQQIMKFLTDIAL